MKKAAISDMFEINRASAPWQSSRVPTQSHSLKKWSPTESKAVADGGKVKAALPAALDSEHQMILDELTAKVGKEFDNHYDKIQLTAHRQAVSRAGQHISTRGRANAYRTYRRLFAGLPWRNSRRGQEPARHAARDEESFKTVRGEQN